MVEVITYKKQSGCPNCLVLDRLLPKVKPQFSGVEWSSQSFSDGDSPPEGVTSFPTSVVLRDGVEVGRVIGYDSFPRKLQEILSETH